MCRNGCAEMNRATPQILPLRGGSKRNREGRKGTWLGCIASVLSGFPRLRREPRSADLQRQDYSTSTQRLGVSFSDIVRDTFRFRWLRRS
jgi:hypothetical protein